MPDGDAATRVVRGASGFVAIGSATIWFSADGQTWSRTVLDEQANLQIFEVVSGGPGYVAGGASRGLLRTISLYSATTRYRQLLDVTTFSYAHSGTLTIRVSSSGKRVLIDGIVIRRN